MPLVYTSHLCVDTGDPSREVIVWCQIDRDGKQSVLSLHFAVAVCALSAAAAAAAAAATAAEDDDDGDEFLQTDISLF